MNIRYILLAVCMLFSSASAMSDKQKNTKLQIDMLSTLMNAPRVLALDSEDANSIRNALAVDAFAHAVKAYNLFQPKRLSSSRKAAIWNQIKMAIHSGFTINSIDTMLDTQLVADDKTEIKAHQKNQILQLFLEFFLRGVALYHHNFGNGKKKVTTVTSEMADVVGILRAGNALQTTIKRQKRLLANAALNKNQEEQQTDKIADVVNDNVESKNPVTPEVSKEPVQAPEPAVQTQDDTPVVRSQDIVQDIMSGPVTVDTKNVGSEQPASPMAPTVIVVPVVIDNTKVEKQEPIKVEPTPQVKPYVDDNAALDRLIDKIEFEEKNEQLKKLHEEVLNVHVQVVEEARRVKEAQEAKKAERAQKEAEEAKRAKEAQEAEEAQKALEAKKAEEVKRAEEVIVLAPETKEVEVKIVEAGDKIFVCPLHGYNPHASIERYPHDHQNPSWPDQLSRAQRKWLAKRNKQYNFDKYECRATENVLRYPTIKR